MGRPPGRALHVDRLRSLEHDRALARRPPFRRLPASGNARVCLGGISVHPVRVELEHERRVDAVLSHLRLLARVVARRARCVRRVLGVDEVRFARRRAVVVDLSRPGGPRDVSSRASLAATLAAFSVVLLEPSPLHELRVFWDRTVTWQVGRDSPFSLWDWKQYYARGLPNLKLRAARAPGTARDRCARCCDCSAAEVAATARRADRGAARRLRARPHVLALHVHSLVLPLRCDRIARARGPPPTATGRCREPAARAAAARSCRLSFEARCSQEPRSSSRRGRSSRSSVVRDVDLRRRPVLRDLGSAAREPQHSVSRLPDRVSAGCAARYSWRPSISASCSAITGRTTTGSASRSSSGACSMPSR